MIFAISTTGGMVQANPAPAGMKKQTKTSPFLIVGKLPHLTKMLMQQWDNPKLNLSAPQKSKLLVVRKETISAVRSLTQKITPLENQVAEGIFAGKTTDDLLPLVKTISDLKSEATMVHLRCIYNTSRILTEQQLAFLKSSGQ